MESLPIGAVDFKKVAAEIMKTAAFGIVLPTGDVGTDIYLSARLFFSGHPHWALSALMPILPNLFFTLLACSRVEKRNWLCYLPLVLLQIYPQFCMTRLLFKWGMKRLNRKQFVENRDKLDCDLGTLEPYLESIPQVFIQTAFFTTLFATTRMCSNLNHVPCERLDNECLELSSKLYSSMCQNEIAARIACPDEKNLYLSYVRGSLEYYNMRWNTTMEYMEKWNTTLEKYYFTMPIKYTASREDFEYIQLYGLVIGDMATFGVTYGISIFAAAYGVTNFFRLHRERFRNGDLELTDCNIIGMLLLNVFHIVLKGVALSIFILARENEMATSATWWFVFNMMPSSILSILANFFNAYQIESEKSSTRSVFKFPVSIKQTFSLFLKMPQILIIPAVTPFVIVEGKEPHHLKLRGSMAVLNILLTIACTAAGLIVEAKWPMVTVLLGAVGISLFITTVSYTHLTLPTILLV